MRHSIRRLLDGITGQLFLDDRDRLLGDYFAYAEPEFRVEYQPILARE